MKLIKILIIATVLAVSNFNSVAYSASSSVASPPAAELSNSQLEKLAQPIALYPDLLLQQVLAASTFPEQLLDAALYNEQAKSPEGITDQPWDASVKAVANYPSVLTMMAADLDWTISLGSAFINQNEDLRNVIQTLRLRAKTVGNLKESEQQHVIEEQSQNGTTIIRIEPAEPQVIYVPTTTTSVVYEKPVQSANLWAPVATFGLGMALGYAMGDNDDHYYYGGGGYYGPNFWHGNAANNWVDYRRDRWNDTYDYARDRQEWRQDNANDWREHRQDLTRKQQEWRQEQGKRPASMSPEQRAQATSKANSAKAHWQGQSPQQRQQALQNKGIDTSKINQDKLNQARQNKGTFSKAGSANYDSFDRTSASQRLNQAKSNPQLQQRAQSFKSSPQVQQRAQTARSSYQSRSSYGSSKPNYNKGSGLSGMNLGNRSVGSFQSRGIASRSNAGGFSRGGGGRRR